MVKTFKIYHRECCILTYNGVNTTQEQKIDTDDDRYFNVSKSVDCW